MPLYVCVCHADVECVRGSAASHGPRPLLRASRRQRRQPTQPSHPPPPVPRQAPSRPHHHCLTHQQPPAIRPPTRSRRLGRRHGTRTRLTAPVWCKQPGGVQACLRPAGRGAQAGVRPAGGPAAEIWISAAVRSGVPASGWVVVGYAYPCAVYEQAEQPE